MTTGKGTAVLEQQRFLPNVPTVFAIRLGGKLTRTAEKYGVFTPASSVQSNTTAGLSPKPERNNWDY